MRASEVNEQGLELLEDAWQDATGDGALEIPEGVEQQIDRVMRPDSQISQRYALLTQLLLKLTISTTDSRQLTGFEQVDGAFSARTFARETVAALGDVTRRLGDSGDPYVSNPLRQTRMADTLRTGRGGREWMALLDVLQIVDDNPEMTRPALVCALRDIAGWPAVAPTATAEEPERLIAADEALPYDFARLAAETLLMRTCLPTS